MGDHPQREPTLSDQTLRAEPRGPNWSGGEAWWSPERTRTYFGPPAPGLRADADASAANGAADPDEPEGRYQMGAEIGRGGVGAVVAGWDRRLQREVALKLLHEEHFVNPAATRRFAEEARIASRLQHPAIVSVHDYGAAAGRPFFAMNLIRGETLDAVLKRRNEPAEGLAQLLAILLQVCHAMAYAHSRGVVHRDLKPANVMVGPHGVVQVMDWGLAKELDAAHDADAGADPLASAADVALDATVMGSVFGTPAYLPPEQARGDLDAVDRRADVFCLGGILCTILTGAPPYASGDGATALRQAAAGATEDARDRLRRCPAALDLISLACWCLSVEPAGRPADAGVVAETLAAHLQSNQRRAEQDLVRFFDLSLDLFCIASPTGHFLRVNDNFPRVLGRPMAELLRRPFLEFVHPDDREKTLREVVKLSQGEWCVRFLNRYRRGDGTYLWFEWNAQAEPGERAIYAVARDVTARVAQEDAARRSELARQCLAAAADANADAVYGVGLDGAIVHWSAGAARLYGYAAAEAVGRPLALLLPAPHAEQEAEALARVRQGQRVEGCLALRRRKDGTAVPVALTVLPVHDAEGQPIGAAEIARGLERMPADRNGRLGAARPA